MTESEFKKLVSEFTDEKLTVTVGGTGGWYDMSYAKQIFNMKHFDCMHTWKNTMNDANLIVGKDYPPEINDRREAIYGGYGYKAYTFDPMKFFKQEEAKMLAIIEDCDIFVSHIGPLVPPNLPSHYQNVVTGFYYFNGEWVLNKEKAPKLWIWGHTHDKYLWKHKNTVLACNPLGYKSENKNAEVEVLDLNDLPEY